MTLETMRVRGVLAAVLLCLTFGRLALADELELKAYNADPAESSVSGFSSGAFMAVQLATAFSKDFRGVGVIAGGPFGCAQSSAWAVELSIMTALGPCMKGPAPDLWRLTRQADFLAASGDIDPLINLPRQKVYVFHGFNDNVIARSVTDKTVEFYRHYFGDASSGNLFYQTSYGAGHSQVTVGWGSGCASTKGPFINDCGYDQAGVILRHIYGALNPGNVGPPTGKLLSFDQGRFTALDPATYSMGRTGYVYVPDACEAGEICRVHVALHGCLQDAGHIGAQYVRNAGYNKWADQNRIIVLYPQTSQSFGLSLLQANPQACWDWWGYQDLTNTYVTHRGHQIEAIHAMVAALTAGYWPPRTAAFAGAVEPARIEVNDTSDTMVALAWTAVPGAESYRVYRAARPEGPFGLAGEAVGPSFTASGLAPKQDDYWQVGAVGGSLESPHTTVVHSRTRATPSPCNGPGNCPDMAN